MHLDGHVVRDPRGERVCVCVQCVVLMLFVAVTRSRERAALKCACHRHSSENHSHPFECRAIRTTLASGGEASAADPAGGRLMLYQAVHLTLYGDADEGGSEGRDKPCIAQHPLRRTVHDTNAKARHRPI